MIRIITIGYLYNLSERKLFEELRMHAAFRWFCNLGFHEPIHDRSTLNKLRNHRWTKDGISQEIMNRIVRQCVAVGLVKGGHVTVDGIQIEADASIKSLEPIVVEVEIDTYLFTGFILNCKRLARFMHHQARKAAVAALGGLEYASITITRMKNSIRSIYSTCFLQKIHCGPLF